MRPASSEAARLPAPAEGEGSVAPPTATGVAGGVARLPDGLADALAERPGVEVALAVGRGVAGRGVATGGFGVGLGVGVWLSALIGIALKLALPGRFDRLAVALCLLLGWSGVIAYDSLAYALPSKSLWLLAIGGILYSLGALFHVWHSLRFHNAIWHGFVLLAASCHYSAVLACLPWV